MSLSVFNTTQYEDLKDITSKIEEQCIQILNEYGQIIFLLDTTLNDSIFNGVIDNLSNKNIAYIPLAHKKGIAKSNLFFICIDGKKYLSRLKRTYCKIYREIKILRMIAILFMGLAWR